MDSLTEDNREMENYDVKYYLIDIVLDFEEEYITADNSIKLEFIENNVSSIQLHFTNNLNIDGIVSGSETISYTHSENIIDIDLGEEYSSGDQLELEIQYSGYPDVRLEDGIKFEEHNNIPVVFSMVSPKGARKWWPCKDTPADKPDSLDIWVTFPEIYTSASNGLLIEEIDNGDGTTTNKWHESYPIATYLTSFAITNYEVNSVLYEYEDQQMMIDNYYYPEQYGISMQIYGFAAEMLDFLSSIYGPYPFLTEKYGHATCTNLGASAMEHQTCTSFDASYIYNEAAEYTAAHELAHHWAGDCLSIDSWSHVWLKEGFASYSEALWAEYLFGAQALHEYMLSEDGGSQLDECLFRDENGSANHIFNWVVYAKGSWTLHMLRGVLGDETFFQLMHEYMQNPDFMYGNVITEDLENATENVCGYEMDWFFDQWFYNYGRPRYFYATYTSDLEDSLKTAVFSEGSSGDPFSMFVQYDLNESSGNLWIEDGFNYQTIQLSGELQDFTFDPENWILDYGYFEEIPVLNEITQQRDGSAVLVWETFFDPAIEGFNVYRKLNSENYILLNFEPITGNGFYDDDVNPDQEYFYKISAVYDHARGYQSKFSNEISIIPVDFTFEDGILLIDGTEDYPEASPFPTDQEVDDFYNDLLTGYEFSNWDINSSGLPPLSELAKYSTLIWHTDDISSYPFGNEFYNIQSYLLAGGNLFLSSWKLLVNLQGQFLSDFLQIQSIEVNPEPDLTGISSDVYSLYLSVDSEKIPLPNWNDLLPYINKFLIDENAQSIFCYDSFSDDPDWENAICGLKYEDDHRLFILGFPLYYFEFAEAEEFFDLAMSDFGEIVSVTDEIPNQDIKLSVYPNPINSNAAISFQTSIGVSSNSEISIYNIRGQKIFEHSGTLSGAEGSIIWDGKNSDNIPAASGIYFVRMKNNDDVVSKRIVIIR